MDLLERKRSYGVDSDADLMAAAFNGGDEDTIRALLVADGYEWAKPDHPRGAVSDAHPDYLKARELLDHATFDHPEQRRDLRDAIERLYVHASAGQRVE